MRHALLLAGGRGKRFWPRSRRRRPKQFMPLDGDKSLLRVTAERLLGVVPFERQWVITHRDYVRTVRALLPEVPRAQIVGEPRGLNTGPAIGFGAALMRERDRDAVMMVQAADHWIRDVSRFRRLAVAAFARARRTRGVVLIGFPPTRPATGYGYIALGRQLDGPAGMRFSAVASFKEKPRAATARRYLAGGRHLWNGCMFFWRADTILDGIASHQPGLAEGLERAVRRLRRGAGVGAVLGRLYAELEPLSIEHGVVERLRDLVVLEGDCGWEDVGTWESLARLRVADGDGNVVVGRHFGIDTHQSLVLGDSGLIATLGLRDVIVVKDGDAVLVLPRAREGELRELIEALEGDGRFDAFL